MALTHKIICADCIEAMKEIDDNSIDSCVTDPPYGLEFMGKEWDKLWAKRDGLIQNLPDRNYGTNPYLQAKVNKYVAGKEAQEWHYQWATELYRVMKPGAYILVFGGTRTYHRMVCAVEDAGFEIKDMILWLYGEGFPKSLDISKAIDKGLGRLGEREVVGRLYEPSGTHACPMDWEKPNNLKKGLITAPATPEAQKWEGFGTALKPACEPIVLAKKPISEHNIAQNVLKWGTGGLNIDGCRISYRSNRDLEGAKVGFKYVGWKHSGNRKEEMTTLEYNLANQQGRFPANVILECCCEDNELIEGKALGNQGHWSKNKVTGYGNFGGGKYEYQGVDKKDDMRCLIHTNPNCVCKMLDEQSGVLTSHGGGSCIFGGIFGNKKPITDKSAMERFKNDRGGASRFFYQAKASQDERWFYCKICKRAYPMKERDNHIHNAPDNAKYQYLEFHPTQKPLQLIRYLIRLVTPPNGTLIDPFMGTGTTIVAAEKEGFNSIGIDNKFEYCEIAIKRIKSEMRQLRIDREPSVIERIGF